MIASKGAGGAMAGRVALITGCGRRRGIGVGIARALASAGCAVAMSDLRSKEAEHGADGLVALADELRADGASALTVFCDLTEPGDIDEAVRSVVSGFGRLDVLVNNAAAVHGTDRGDPARVELADLDALLTINVRAAFLLIQAAIPIMRNQRYGRIVNMSSQAGRIGTPGRAVYSMTKSALLGLTRALAVDLGRDGITVNAICPGAIATDRLTDTMSTQAADGRPAAGADDDEGRVRAWADTVPMGRLGLPSDIGAAVVFLASPDAEYVTGHALAVDGGRFAL
jgi:NAD(P)-dependent dehydrogenase (short-subunit alcohol dehydrogenase family)